MVVAAVVAVAAGCGQTNPAAPPPVRVSLTAPTDGARVSARNLVVLGTVDPPGAVVKVGGTAVRVANSSFKQRVPVGWGVHSIRVEATAPGYLPTLLQVVVHNEPYRVTPVLRHGTHGRRLTSAYVREANATCASSRSANLSSAWASSRAFASHTGRDPAPIRHAIDSVGRLLGRLQRIHVPQASGSSYAAFLATYQGAIGGMGTLLADSASHAPRLASDIAGLSLTFRTAGQIGYSLGLQVCTNGLPAR